MSASVAIAKLNRALKDLNLHWQNTSTVWHDSASTSFKNDVIDEIDPAVRHTLSAMNSMAELIQRIKSDCT